MYLQFIQWHVTEFNVSGSALPSPLVLPSCLQWCDTVHSNTCLQWCDTMHSNTCQHREHPNSCNWIKRMTVINHSNIAKPKKLLECTDLLKTEDAVHGRVYDSMAESMTQGGREGAVHCVVWQMVPCSQPSVFGRKLQCEPVRKCPSERASTGNKPALFNRAGVGAKGIIGCKFLSKARTVRYKGNCD